MRCAYLTDYDLPAGDPMSFEVDEIVPVSLGGSPIDPNNVQPAHRICNQRKGNRLGFTIDDIEQGEGSKYDGCGPVGTSFDWASA